MPDTPSDKPAEIALETRNAAGAKLYSPSAARNREAIAEAILPFLPEGARVLELGSGTGDRKSVV